MPTGISTLRHWKIGMLKDSVLKLSRHSSVLMRLLKWGPVSGGQEDKMGGQQPGGCERTWVVIKSCRKCIAHFHSN